MINARRYSIYIKNVPQDKFNNVDIDTFFNHFGEVVRIDRHPEKQAATVKFKDIESAEKAANYAI
jgi:RNA recognition motif-containing protein